MSAPPSPGLLERGRLAAAHMWQRRALVVGVGWTVALLGALCVAQVPQRYEALARVYVDTQSVLKPLMDGLAYQPDIDQQVRMVARTVLTRPRLESLLQRPELGLPAGDSQQREATLTRLMNRIKLTPTEAGLYVISYRDADPLRAQRIVAAMLDLFVNSGSGDQVRDSTAAQQFITNQIAAYEVKLSEAESRLKEFKIRNFGVSGMSNQDFFLRMATLSDQLDRLRADLLAAERAREAYRAELLGEEPQLQRGTGGEGGLPLLLDVDTELAAQHKRLDELHQRYTDQHPDVMAVRRLIEELEARQRREAEARARSRGGKGVAVAATSPVYQRLRVALADSEAQVASLRSRVASEQARLDEARTYASRIPQVEAELAQMNRDYDVVRKNYDQLVSRREAATLGVKLDESSRLRDFRLVDPPRVGAQPVFPSRITLAWLTVLVSLAAGLCAPAVVDTLRPTVRDVRSLREWSGRPVLGTVSVSRGTGALRRLPVGMGAAMGALSLLIVQGVWLAWMATRSAGST